MGTTIESSWENERLKEVIASLKSELKAINAALDDPRTDLTMTACEVITSLKAQLIAEKAGHAAREDEHIRQAAEMEVQLVECKKDAERYKFLKKGYGCQIELMEQSEEDGEFYGVCCVKGNYIDATIDAAMAQKEEA